MTVIDSTIEPVRVNNTALTPTIMFPCVTSSTLTTGFELFHMSVFLRKSV